MLVSDVSPDTLFPPFVQCPQNVQEKSIPGTSNFVFNFPHVWGACGEYYAIYSTNTYPDKHATAQNFDILSLTWEVRCQSYPIGLSDINAKQF